MERQHLKHLNNNKQQWEGTIYKLNINDSAKKIVPIGYESSNRSSPTGHPCFLRRYFGPVPLLTVKGPFWLPIKPQESSN